MLLDSNIIIYSAEPQYNFLRVFMATHNPVVSAISYVEVLGYHKLTPTARIYFEGLFTKAVALDVSPVVIARAVSLRQQRKMSIGDSIIAATALVHDLTLVTRNEKDFTWIAGLTVLNPFSTPSI